MIVTKEYICELREKSLMKISRKAEKILLAQLGHKPEPYDKGHCYTYTEKDLYEQINRIIMENP